MKGNILFAAMLGVMIMATGNRMVAADAGTVVSKVDSEKAAVAKVIHDAICWALTKNRPLQESTMAHDEDLVIFWTNSGTTIFGWKQYVKLFDIWMDQRFKATLTEIRDLRINMSQSGHVAWFSATLDDENEWDGKPRGARDIRWTGVLEKREGTWVFVQMHGSLAADKVAEQVRRDLAH